MDNVSLNKNFYSFKKLKKGGGTMQRRSKGFTLVELAIVLVIIGFLLAMGLKGSELIRSAKLQKEAYKFKKIAAAIGTYYNNHNVLPGDGYGGRNGIPSPRDGIIQWTETGPAFWQLESDGLIDDDTRKINEIDYIFC